MRVQKLGESLLLKCQSEHTENSEYLRKVADDHDLQVYHVALALYSG